MQRTLLREPPSRHGTLKAQPKPLVPLPAQQYTKSAHRIMNSPKEKSRSALILIYFGGFQEADIHTNTQQQTKRRVLLNNYGAWGHKHRLNDEKTNEAARLFEQLEKEIQSFDDRDGDRGDHDGHDSDVHVHDGHDHDDGGRDGDAHVHDGDGHDDDIAGATQSKKATLER